MIVNDDTVNRGYMLVEKYMVVPKHGIIIPGVQGMHPHALGKMMIGEDKDKFCLFPAHVGYDVDTRYQSFLFIPIHEIICFVEPEEHERFEPYKKLNPPKEGDQWIGTTDR